MTDYDHVKPRTVAKLKLSKVGEISQMNTVRTLEITMPDGYTADEVREHLAKLPAKKLEPGQVAYLADYPFGNWRAEPSSIKERYAKTEQACREGYVEKDKIETALANREASPVGVDYDYAEGFRAGRDKLSQLIREAMK